MENIELKCRVRQLTEAYYQEILKQVEQLEKTWQQAQQCDGHQPYRRKPTYQDMLLWQLVSHDHRPLEIEAAALGYDLIPLNNAPLSAAHIKSLRQQLNTYTSLLRKEGRCYD
jgi:hypothetical protein